MNFSTIYSLCLFFNFICLEYIVFVIFLPVFISCEIPHVTGYIVLLSKYYSIIELYNLFSYFEF